MSVINKFIKNWQGKDDLCSAVIVAAGSSQRMGKDKILMPIKGKPVIAYTLEAFEKAECIDEIIVVTKLANIGIISDICNEYGITKASKVVCGGKCRLESSIAGVAAVSEDADIIAIHDGARPFVTPAVIERCVNAARADGASAPAINATDTVRILNKKGGVASTPDRSLVALVQTPQVFSAELIRNALIKAHERDLPITDDCSAVEALGGKITIVTGDIDNIKLTTAHDICIAERIVEERSELQ